jgi:hypothetical protein
MSVVARKIALQCMGVLVALACARDASALDLTLAWDSPVGSAIIGYVISYGTAPGVYPTSIDVGNVLSVRLTNLLDQTPYYFAVQSYDAYRNLSAYSKEIVFEPLALMCHIANGWSSTGDPVAVDVIPPDVTGGLGVKTTTCTPPSGSMFPVGTTPLTCSTTDSTGTAMCQSHVTVTRVASGWPVDAVTVSTDKMSPQPPGTTVTATAAAAGGAAPLSYKFLLTTDNWTTWTVLQDWSSTATASWTPSPSTTYGIGVWARSAGNSSYYPEAADSLTYGNASGQSHSLGELFWRDMVSGDVRAWLMNGTTVSQASLAWNGVPFEWQIAGVGDLDGDSKPDLIYRNTQTGDIGAWLMDGASVRQMALVWPGVPVEYQIAGIGDVDGDQRADIIFRNTSTGDILVWLMNGTALKQVALVYSGVPLEWQIAGLTDLDGDGKADLVFRNTRTGDIGAWLMDGTAVKQMALVWSGVPLAWQIVGLGDLDGDSMGDLVFRNTVTGDVAAWLMSGVTPKQMALVSAAEPLTSQIAAVADLDGNSRADLIFRNTQTGDVSAWFMDGTTVLQRVTIAQGAPLSWLIQ